MELEIAGYRLGNLIHRGRRTLLYRGQRVADGTPVVVKVPSADFPDAADLNRLQAEFDVLRRLAQSGMASPLGLEAVGTSVALVLAWHDGRSVRDLAAGRPLPIDDFLDLAARMAALIGTMHDAQVIHRDLHPGHFILATDGAMLALTGFDGATVIARQAPSVGSHGALEGTLAYMSPEQTGRMNRSIDYRTDLYSLGVIFYEMLTGQLPFAAADPLQLVYHHLARQPRAPHELWPEVPPLLSHLVLRLLAKSAEERYQSAAGLEADLRAALATVRAGHPLPDAFDGPRELSNQFHIPEKLYGRQQEVERLLGAFARTGRDRPSLILVSGSSGIGKSSLVNEIQRPVVSRHGYFVAGKFEQFKRNVPFASLHQALRSLVRQVLTEDDARIGAHRQRVLDAVGPNAQVVVDMVPELGLLLGPQPPVPELPATEARNRFQRALRNVVSVFAAPEHPLCLFLDDLQWVDSATLDWLEMALASPELASLFLIGAFREQEVPISHPLALALARLRDQGAAIEEITLQPLAAEVVAQLVCDTLHSDAETCRPLAQLVFDKTRGSPFFVNQLLESLHQEGAISFSAARRCWVFDLARAQAAAITDNVVEFMTSRIQRLVPPVLEMLKVAACVGNVFELATLRLATGLPRGRLLALVNDAMQQGFIQKVGQASDSSRYRFQHDRVQQAAYALMSDEQTRRTRLGIGRLMLEAAPDAAGDERLFDILQHLNFAATALTERDECERVARLNLAAATRARSSTAYAAAAVYAAQATELAARAGVDESGSLSFALALERAECEHLVGHDAEAEQHFDLALERAADDFAKARVYEKRIHFYNNRAEFRRAFETGVAGARLFGVRLPSRFIPPLFVADYALARVRLIGQDLTQLVDMPRLGDERFAMAMRFMAIVGKSAFQLSPELCVAICTKIVRLSLARGNTPDSAIGYLAFGVIFSGAILGNSRLGFKFGRLVLALVDRFDNVQQKAEVNFVYGYFAHPWSRPLASTEPFFLTAYQSGIETGDYFHASCACAGIVQNMFLRGVALESVWGESERRLEFLRSVKAHETAAVVLGVRQAIRSLRGQTRSPATFEDEGFDEPAFVTALDTYTSTHFAHWYFINKLQALCLWREHDAAQAAAEASRQYLKGSAGLQQVAEHYFWSALLEADLLLRPGYTGRRAPGLKRIRNARRRFLKWEQGCPENYRHRRLLLDGELARVRGDHAAAAECYDEAIDAAGRQGFVQHEALANELAGRLALARGRRRAARFYFRDAAYGYERWGATALAATLEQRYRGLDTGETTPARAAGPALLPTGSSSAELDVATIMKSSQAISGEVQLRPLLAKLLLIAIENAGAERAVLMLRRDDELLVQAEGRFGDEQMQILQATPFERFDGAARSVVNFVSRSREHVVLADAVADPMYGADPYVLSHHPRSVLCAPLLNQGHLTGVLYLENNLATDAFTAERIDVLAILSAQMAIAIDNAMLYESLEDKVRERTSQLEARNQFIRRTFGRYLSDDVVTNLLETSAGSHLGGQKRKVTILMSDLRGFTSMADRLPPETVVSIINNYLGTMTEVILKYQGTIDEFIGDAILAIFGAPTLRDDDAERAVACAIAMQRAMDEVNAHNRRAGLDEIAMGIGVNTGEVVAGSIGSEKRAKYGVVGASVNVASRIESYTLPGQILISQSTRDDIGVPLRVDGEMRVHPKGLREAITIYAVGAIGGAHAVDLPVPASVLLPMARALRVQWAEVHDKRVSQALASGSIERLSADLADAAVSGTAPTESLSTLHVVLLDASGAPCAAPLYARLVGTDSDGSFQLRFTSIPDDARAVLAAAAREVAEIA